MKGLDQLIFLAVVVAAFWFMIFRPQQQRAKAHAALMDALKVGDEIVTVGGIYATVVELHDDRLRVSVADGSQMEIARGAVGSVLEPASGDDAADSDSVADLAEKDEDA